MSRAEDLAPELGGRHAGDDVGGPGQLVAEVLRLIERVRGVTGLGVGDELEYFASCLEEGEPLEAFRQRMEKVIADDQAALEVPAAVAEVPELMARLAELEAGKPAGTWTFTCEVDDMSYFRDMRGRWSAHPMTPADLQRRAIQRAAEAMSVGMMSFEEMNAGLRRLQEAPARRARRELAEQLAVSLPHRVDQVEAYLEEAAVAGYSLSEARELIEGLGLDLALESMQTLRSLRRLNAPGVPILHAHLRGSSAYEDLEVPGSIAARRRELLEHAEDVLERIRARMPAWMRVMLRLVREGM